MIADEPEYVEMGHNNNMYIEEKVGAMDEWYKITHSGGLCGIT